VPPSAQPPAPRFNSYFGSPGTVGSPSSSIYPAPGVYGGLTFNPFGTPGIPLSASTTPAVRFPELISGAAYFEVRLPDNARLWVDEQPTKQIGTLRVFISPDTLMPGRTYHYTFRAEWDEGGRTVVRQRSVAFRSGERVSLSFSPGPTPPQPAPVDREANR